MLTVFLIAWPIASVLFVALTGRYARWAALFSTLVQLAVTLFITTEITKDPFGYFGYHSDTLVCDANWISQFGIRFNVGMDGISLLMVILTGLVMPLIIWSSFKQKISRPAVFYSLALVMQAAMTGVFVARDAFLYYVFWDLGR
jgi:NADH-quinone oxidoreductase subunit M